MANKTEVTTRIEEENKTVGSEDDTARKSTDTMQLPDDSDEEAEALQQFSLKEAWKNILKMPECHQIMIGVPTQRALGIEVGVNVSQEFPWKQVQFKFILDKLFDEIERGKELQELFPDLPPDDFVLMGYMPTLTEDQVQADPRDPFLIFSDHDAARTASQIIRNIEIYEKWVINKALVKKSQVWKNYGSDREVELGIPQEKEFILDIEIQSVYPVQPFKPQHEFRKTSDVRDGYAELIPINIKAFENFHRKRLHIAVQSAPAKVNLEQQTDPTFPTNAWSQYLYEIQAEDDGLDETSEDEEKSKPLMHSPAPSPVSLKPKEPPSVSKEIEDLLKILEFNQVDMYRNDYSLISDVKVSKFTSPYLEDIFCYADISKSHHRFVSCVDWYPAQSGVLAISYCYKTHSTYESLDMVDDMEGNVIMNPTISLVWSFSDSLNFKLELSTTRGVTALSFCPYCPNLLIGGRYNGSIVLWDFQQRIDNLDDEEIITIDQAKYREQMKEFLDWSLIIDEKFFVNSAFISAHDTSPLFCITNIIWLQQKHYVTTSGKILEAKDGKIQRFFLTSSIDGLITFWNLDINMDKKIAANQRGKLPVPPLLTTQQSDFDKYDRIFKPIYMLTYSEPISFTIYEGAKFKYEPYGYMKNEKDFAKKYPIKVTPIVIPKKVKKTEKRKAQMDDDENLLEIDTLADKESHQILISSTFFGNIVKYSWDGYEIDMGNPVNKEKITNFKSFAHCHDGPILGLEQNPYYTDIFVSIGRYILAIWKKDYLVTPILWRKRPSELTCVKWSTDRPAVLYVTRTDGYFEAWDILARDDEPSLSDVLGGGIITGISEHRPSIPKKVLGIADYNSSFRMVALPSSFNNPYPNEKESLEKFIEKEEKRKKAIKNWEIHWMNKNQDIREARKLTIEEAARDLDKFKEESEKKSKRKSREVDDEEDTRKSKEVPKPTKKSSFDLPEKLEKMWDEMNLKRLLDALMSRKMVDADKLEKQTFLEKQRLAYEKNKRIAIKTSILKIHDEIAEIRSRLLPIHKIQSESDVICGLVKNIIDEAKSFQEVEKDCDAFIAETPIEGDINFTEFFIRGAQRRKLINRSLGGNTQRLDLFKKMKMNKKLDDFDYGYDQFIVSSEIVEDSDYDQTLHTPSYSDLDEIPVKDD